MIEIIAFLALGVSLWNSWQLNYHRKPKASVRINSGGSGFNVNPDGASESLPDNWDVTVCNIGKVPLVLTDLSLLKRTQVSVNDVAVGNAGLQVSLEDTPPTRIAVDDVQTFRVSADRPQDAPADYDPDTELLLSLSLTSSRGVGGLRMPINELSQSVIVDSFLD